MENRHPATCTRCDTTVEPGAGQLFKRYPHTADMPWLVRCTDEAGCKARSTAAKAARAAQADLDAEALHQANLTNARQRLANGTGPLDLTDAQRNALHREKLRSTTAELPKTLTLEWDESPGQIRFTRRQVKAGVKVTRSYLDPDGTVLDTDEVCIVPTEAEAIGRTLAWLRSHCRWSTAKDTEAWATMKALTETA